MLKKIYITQHNLIRSKAQISTVIQAVLKLRAHLRSHLSGMENNISSVLQTELHFCVTEKWPGAFRRGENVTLNYQERAEQWKAILSHSMKWSDTCLRWWTALAQWAGEKNPIYSRPDGTNWTLQRKQLILLRTFLSSSWAGSGW